MRVLAVTQQRFSLQRQVDRSGELRAGGLSGEIIGDGSIIGGGVREGITGQSPTQLE